MWNVYSEGWRFLLAKARNARSANRHRSGKAWLVILASFLGSIWLLLAGMEAALASPIYINSIADLQNIQNDLSGDYVLANDIDASGFDFAPIETFWGTLDGGGHSIQNLTINSSARQVGLFSVLVNGNVQNLNLVNAHVTSSASGPGTAVATLVGLNNDGVIKNVTASGSISGAAGTLYASGLVGMNGAYPTFNSNSVVSQSSSSVVINGGNWAGGLVGLNEGLITQSSSTGSVTATSDDIAFAGGLVSINNFGTISNSFSTGNVAASTTSHSLVEAGLVALNNGSILNSYSTGAAAGSTAGSGAVFSGGLTAEHNQLSDYNGNPIPSVVINSYWDTQASGQNTSDGGVGLTTAQLQSGTLPPGFDPTIWNASSGQYPKLKSQTSEPSSPPPPIPSGPDLSFPLKGTSAVSLVTMAGGLSADSSMGTFCGIALSSPTYLDPCHTANKAYYALDFVQPIGASNEVVAAASGFVAYVNPLEVDGRYSPQIVIDNGLYPGSSSHYFTVYQEFGVYDTKGEAVAAGNKYVQPGDIVVAGQQLGVLVGGDGHLHFQVDYGCDTVGCATKDKPLGDIELEGRKLADWSLNGISSCVLDDVAMTVTGCTPTSSRYGSSSLPVLPEPSGKGYSYNLAVGALGLGLSSPIYVDPAIAIGYDFEIQSGPLFRSVVLPDVGDGEFDLYLFNSILSDYVFDATVHSGETFDFGVDGVSAFRVLGIEESAGIDGDDPGAFVTGLTFTADGDVSFTQTAMTNAAPEPSTLFMFGASLMLLAGMESRKKHRKVEC